MKQVTTQDNPWSSADVSYYLNCNVCQSDWMVENQSLISRKEKVIATKVWEQWRKIVGELDDLIAPLVDKYFHALSLKTKSAELLELERLGIADCDIRSFRKKRNLGQPISAACSARRNIDWVRQLAVNAGVGDLFEKLETNLLVTEQSRENASQAIRYVRIP